MPPSWVPIIQAIINNEPIDAAVTNRPLGQLAERTEYLHALFTTTGIGKGSYDFDAACTQEVYEGAAVFWNGELQQYDNALAALKFNEEGNYGSYEDSTYNVGICVAKSSSQRGVIALNGRVDDVDFTTSVGGPLAPGPYYLSMVTPGAMTKEKPAVGILAMFGMSLDSTMVMPTFKDLVEDHIHYTSELDTTTGVSSATKGWVAAANPIFGSLAPVGAVYGYNLSQDEKVDNLFPFVPAASVYYELDGIGSQTKITSDNNGIWWMDAGTDPSDSTLIRAYFVKMVTKTNNTSVTSLQPGTDQPIRFVNCLGEDATTGDLRALLDLVFNLGVDDTAGWKVFKELTGTNQLERGPVVESITSDSLDISFVDDAGTPQGEDTANGKAGQLVINYTPSELGRENPSTIVALYNAREESYETGTEEIPYLALPEEQFSRISYRFDVPSVGLVSPTYTFTFWSWVLATIGALPTGTDLPLLHVQYKIVSKATSALRPTLTPGFSTAAALVYDPDGVGMIANQYVYSYYTGIAVAPGDQVYVLLNRNMLGDDGYGGDIGILRAGYKITAAP